MFESLNSDFDAFIKKFGLDRYYKDSFAEIRQLKDDIENIDQTMMIIDRNIENKNISANSVSKSLEITKQDLSHKRYWFLEWEIFNIDFREYIQKLRSYLVDKKEKPEINRYIFDNFIYKIVIGISSRDNINIV